MIDLFTIVLTTSVVPIERDESMPVDHFRRVVSPFLMCKHLQDGVVRPGFSKLGVNALNSIMCHRDCPTKGYLKERTTYHVESTITFIFHKDGL